MTFRIHDRTPGEVFDLLPWSYRIILIAGGLFVVFALIYVPYVIWGQRQANDAPVAVDIRGDGITGRLDPSVASDGGRGMGLLFTALGPAEGGGVAAQVRVAVPADGCMRWTALGTVFQSKNESLIGPDGVTPVTSGNWRIETPTLVYDAADKGREWKAYAYKYFWSGDVPLARLYGFIVASTAPKPEGPWSAEEWILSADARTPPMPYGQLVKDRLNTLDPSLADVYFYTRPSALAVNDVILMTVNAFVRGKETVDRVVLLASIDHGQSWKYLGTPLTDAALAQVDGGKYRQLAGATLVSDGGTIYLAAVPVTAAAAADGTVLVPFDDVLKGTLRRDAATGAPIVHKYIPRVSVNPDKTGGGFATYSAACGSGGVMTSEFSGLTGQYELMNTRIRPGGR